MMRPCFLVIDREYAGSISTRKLVIETAKFNVLTAYSGAEAIDIFRTFPRVQGVVADTGIEDIPFESLVRELKQIRSDIPVIAIHTPGSYDSSLADYQLDSFEPVRLLELLRKLQPEESQAIEQRNKQLAREKGSRNEEE